MKKIFTHLFVAVLLMLSSTSWAQSETNYTVTPSDGSYNQTGWCSNWTSNSSEYPVTKIDVAGGINNMNASTTSSGFEMAVGTNGNSNYTWNFSVPGYKIESYSFKFKSKNNNQNVNVVAGSQTITSSYSEEKTLEVNDVNAQIASFQLTGSNYAIIVTELTFTVTPILEVAQVYMFKNARPDTDRSLSADGTNDVHTKTTDVNDTKQQWYVTKDGDYYVLRNLACGKYLKGNGQSSAWSMTDDYSHDYNKFELYVSNTTYNTLHTKTLGTHAYMHDSNNGDNGGYEIVGWTNADDAAGSHWTITKVNYTAEQIKALLDAAPTIAEVEAYDDALAAIFADAACTALKDSYASMSVESIKADVNYIALPAALQKIVLKIRNDDWAEDNADATKQANNLNWDAEYAKKFRVQMYEPYSIAGDITSWLGINAHANNDNPTGIYMPAAGTLYVMVEGEVKEGATLRLINGGPNWRITDAASGGHELTTGLNIINFTEATGMLYICYNVDTYNPNGATHAEKFPHKLSEFAPLKIHIEGGAINGFYNACGDFRAATDEENLWKVFTEASVDCDADWTYMETRANLSVVPVLGHRQILLFQLNDEDTEGNKGMKTMLPDYISVPTVPHSRTEEWSDFNMSLDTLTHKINIMMEAWDRIIYSEHATMGLLSDEDMAKMNDLFPRWKADKTYAEIYDYTGESVIDDKTYREFCQGVDYSEYFNHHGVALGVGGDSYMYGGWDHCGYHHNTMGSVIGKLASEPGPTWGPAHEIGHQHQGIFNLNGQTEVTNNFFSNVAVWYMGMGTSRVNGSEGSLNSVLGAFNTENNDAYTNNIWALTHIYYRLWLYYHLAGNNTQFWPRLFELLRNERLQNGGQISGDRSLLLFYKHACDAAGEDLTEFFRAHGYLEVMDNRLVGDYSNATYNQTQEMVDEAIAYVKDKWSKQNYSILLINDGTSETTLQHNGKDSRSLWDGSATAEFGSVSDFIDGDVEVLTNYAATVNADGSITMSGGQGGVGFLVFNEKGELISFSNKSTFKLSDEALEAIVSGKATITTVDTENKVTNAEVDVTAMQRTVLEQLIAKAQSIVDKVDDTYTKIGYFKGAAVADLASALAYAREVCEGSSGYEAAYDLLYAEYTKVLENKDSKIPFNPSLTYIIKNKAYSSETMWVNGSGVVRSEGGVDQTSDDAKWKFVETSTAGVYNIRTLSNKYIPAVQQSTSMNATSDKADDNALYTLEEVADGVWAIKLSPAAGYRNLHSSWSNVVGWETGADASRWYLTAVAADPVIADLADLEVYINKTEQLLNEVVGAVTYTKGEALSLQTGTQGSAGYLWSNAPEDSEGSISYLVDGTTGVNANYFHTEWSSEPPSGSHYLAVYLGEENTLERFTFSHTTRAGVQNDFPKSVDVYGSDDNVTYKYIGSASGMPQSAGTAWEFGGVMQSSYKYLRFNYHASRGYWHMAEFDITPITGFTATVNDVYSGTVSVDAVTAAMNALHNGKRTANSISPTSVDIDAKLQALQSAYETLYGQYEATINARKETLEQLATATETLINQVGNVAFSTDEEKLVLTTGNFYCNDPHLGNGNDDSENYVSKLTDGKTDTYLHTDYNNTNTGGFPHYLRIDLGENCTATGFKFTYTTRNNGNDCPTEIVVAGCDTPDGEYATICTLRETDAVNPLPNGVSLVYASSEISRPSPYRYIRLTVTKTENRTNSYFVISEFGFTTVEDKVEVTVNNAYKNFVTDELLLTTVHTTNSSKSMSTNALVTSVPLLDTQIADQQAAKAALEEAIANVVVDKTALQSLYDNALVLYGEMADGEGHVNSYYEPSALTNEKLAEAKTALDAAKTVLDSSNSQGEIDAAKDALQTQYDALLAIKNTDFTGRDELNALIGDMQSLLGEVADKTTAKTALALQTTDEDDSFYIWSNATAWDCDGIGALIDKNDDGTAKTGTFFGTTWDGGAVSSYDHYIAVDLGVDVAISELSIDYTTRNSTHANQRPTSIKVLGSNDKEGEYAEITTLSEGMPVGQNQKWEMTSTVALDSYYRYIRFAVATEMGYFNMSDFNLYAHSALVTNSDYQPAGITGEQLYAMNVALLDGIDARDKFVTEDNYNVALAALQEHIATLNAIKNANVSDRNSLANLITETNTLLADVAKIDGTEAKIALQCDDENAPYYIYCNAPGATNNYPGDNLGVAALLDYDDGGQPMNSTHLHTTYTGNSHDDELDHYLRVDMGENSALEVFKFAYIPRSGNTSNSPKVMLIEGSNDCVNFEEIATLTDMQPTYQSDVITNGKAYRYIRFMVKETHTNDKYNGHPYFVLSHFEMTACKTISVAQEYASPNLPLSTVVAANNEAVDGTTVKEQFYVTETVYNTAVDELQAAKDALATAIALKNIPVILTTDVNNPVLYKIKIKSNEKVFTYDGKSGDASKNPILSVDALGNKYQAWYFMQGNNEDSNDDILILPYYHEGALNTTHKLGYPNINGATQPAVSETGASSYNWYITFTKDKTTEGWWNLQPQGGTVDYTYVNQQGGSSSTILSFWKNESNPNDPGSQFQFVLDETDYSLSDAYYALYNLHVSYGGTKVAGTAIGCYISASVDEYNAAYQSAAELLETATAGDDEYKAAHAALETAYNSLERIMPVAGGLYRLKSAYSGGYSDGEYIYADTDNSLYFSDAEEALSKYIWQFEEVDGGYYVKNLHTDSYISTAAWGDQVILGDSPGKIILEVLDDATGILGIKTVGHPLHAQDAGSKVVGYTGGLNSASAWYVEELENVAESFKHTETLSALGYGTLMLNYDAKVPDGVKAYVANNIEGSTIVLSPIEGDIIPANTAVILKKDNIDGNTLDMPFKYSTAKTGSYEDNMLRGTLFTKVVKCDTDDVNNNIYMMQNKNGAVKMYWMYENYNAEGQKVQDDNGSTNNDLGGYVKCSANRAYLVVPQSTAQNSAAYSFRFAGPTTGIDEIESGNGMSKGIYDLQGRKYAEITEPGIYIVDGKKVVVK